MCGRFTRTAASKKTLADMFPLSDPPGSSGISLLLGNGNGTFQSSYVITSGPGRLIAADFNNDGNLDLAVADSGRRTVDLLLGNGNGSFQTARHYVPGVDGIALAAGDFNGDGFLDLAVTGGSNGVAVLLNAARPSNHVRS
jgi:hypothetical protein